MRPNYKVELASGIFLMLGIAALIWLATKATNYGQEIGDEAYFVKARFTNVAELKNRAPIKIGGVTVGLVESITLDPVMFVNACLTKAENLLQGNDIPFHAGNLA